MCEDQFVRMIIKLGEGVPTIPVSADHRNGDWIATDIYEGEFYQDTLTDIIYNRTPTGITTIVSDSNPISLNIGCLKATFVSSTTYYLANYQSLPITTAGTYRLYPNQVCEIISASINTYASTAVGTNESIDMYIRVNNTTDYLIASVGSATAERLFVNSSLSIPLIATDYFEIKIVVPAMATAPTGVYVGGFVTVK